MACIRSFIAGGLNQVHACCMLGMPALQSKQYTTCCLLKAVLPTPKAHSAHLFSSRRPSVKSTRIPTPCGILDTLPRPSPTQLPTHPHLPQSAHISVRWWVCLCRGYNAGTAEAFMRQWALGAMKERPCLLVDTFCRPVCASIMHCKDA